MKTNKIVLHIPHSSMNGIFDKHIGKWHPNAFFVNDCVRELTDWYVDMLFHIEMEGVEEVVFPFSRFVCDVERLPNDEMEKIGQGIIYTHYRGYKRGLLTEDDRRDIYQLYNAHQEHLRESLSEGALLIDCHSFADKDYRYADICIGFNEDESYDKGIVNTISAGFKKSGYSVSFNEPYSNSIYPDTGFAYHSVMIEVNKRIYMDNNTLLLNKNARQWMRWYGCLERIYRKLLFPIY